MNRTLFTALYMYNLFINSFKRCFSLPIPLSATILDDDCILLKSLLIQTGSFFSRVELYVSNTFMLKTHPKSPNKKLSQETIVSIFLDIQDSKKTV